MARYTQLPENEIQEIASNYGLTVSAFEAMEGGAGNSSYLLQTQQGSTVLTVFDDKTWSYVNRLGQLLLLLAEYEFPTTHPLSSVKGGMITMYRAKPVMLKAYIAGQVCKDLSETMLQEVGAAMARLHQLPTPDFLLKTVPYGRENLSAVIGRNIDPEYESWLAERFAHLEQRTPPGLPSGLIHGDLFYDNILFEKERFKAIIDFEDACCYYKGFDLGMGILGLCAEGVTVSLDKARALVTGYQQVRMLEESEKEILQLFVEYAAISVSCWRFWKYHIDTPIPEKADKHRQMVRLAEGVRAMPKAKFLTMVSN
jgi:homoserine kinase type II